MMEVKQKSGCMGNKRCTEVKGDALRCIKDKPCIKIRFHRPRPNLGKKQFDSFVKYYVKFRLYIVPFMEVYLHKIQCHWLHQLSRNLHANPAEPLQNIKLAVRLLKYCHASNATQPSDF